MFKVGILGSGWIARKMAETLAPMADYEAYAIASRSLEKAQAFAAEFSIAHAYGSYEEMLSDPQVDLVYIATPHSHHYPHTRMAIEHGKPCLVEKAFTANAREAEELITFAREKGVFITEAIWTRYMPTSHHVAEVLASGIIGEPTLITAGLCYKMDNKQRIYDPALCGGALLDLGVYPINFARMYFGSDVSKVMSYAQLGPTGMDMQDSITFAYADGRMACLHTGALCRNDRRGVISGTKGCIVVDNCNIPSSFSVYVQDELVASYPTPSDWITGYEYQVMECRRCLEAGLLESPMMPHAETLDIMRLLDSLRAEWGVRYPMD